MYEYDHIIQNVDIKNASVMNKIKKRVLRWFGHVELMREERNVRRIYDTDVNGRRSLGCLRKTCSYHEDLLAIQSDPVSSRGGVIPYSNGV